MTLAACPDRGQLRDFLLGKVDSESLEEIAEHLETCDKCDAIAFELEGATDSLLAVLRAPVPSSPFGQEVELQRALSGALQSSRRPSGPRWTAARLPEQFGRYRISGLLGAGSMGSVYQAWDTQLERDVAIKVPHFSFQESRIRDRFIRESKLASRIDHPNVCRIFDAGECDGLCYLAMSYIEGTSLDVCIADGRFTQREAARIAYKIALGMQETHRHGIVHRDLKPSNVLIRSDGETFITDFGLARLFDSAFEDSCVTVDGMLVGSPAYMAPEQATHSREGVGPASDIYALGVILFELLTGSLPFTGTVSEVVAQIIGQPAPVPSTRGTHVESALDEICLTAMEKDPRSRFASMEQFAEALAAYLSDDTIGERSAETPLRVRTNGFHVQRDRVAAGAPGPTQSRLRAILPSLIFGVLLLLAAATIYGRFNAQRTGGSPDELIAASADVRPSNNDLETEGQGAAELEAPMADTTGRYGAIRLLLDDNITSVNIDGLPLDPLSQAEPLVLRVGDHAVQVRWNDIIVNAKRFVVQPGENPPVDLRIRRTP